MNDMAVLVEEGVSCAQTCRPRLVYDAGHVILAGQSVQANKCSNVIVKMLFRSIAFKTCNPSASYEFDIE